MGFPSGLAKAKRRGMKLALFSLAALVLVAGCATTAQSPAISVAYDEDDIAQVEKSKTYHWSLPTAGELNPYNNQDVYLALVKNDIDAHLAKKGYKLVTKGGDLEVSFLMLYKDGATTAIVDQYFGTNRAPERKIVAAVNRAPDQNFEVGTLVVDAENARDHESLWRGAVSAPVDRSKPYEAQKTRIENAVSVVMAGFPAAK
jgi:hypothetical protein